jgi:hypothetical protein
VVVTDWLDGYLARRRKQVTRLASCSDRSPTAPGVRGFHQHGGAGLALPDGGGHRRRSRGPAPHGRDRAGITIPASPREGRVATQVAAILPSSPAESNARGLGKVTLAYRLLHWPT